MGKHYLNKLFEPDAVAVFGVSDRERAVGNLVFKNMIEGGFKGDVFPINLKHEKVSTQLCRACKTFERLAWGTD